MNIIFMRHGEATDNVAGLISDKEIYWSVLTESGIDSVKKSIEVLPKNINKIYVSPLPRTIQTAHFVCEKFKGVDAQIDNRIREINYGKFSHKPNNEILDKTREKQANGDYFIRFGGGENKLEIELRLCDFLIDISNNNKNSDTILIISHGSIISFMKRILKIKSEHIKTGQVEKIENVDFDIVKEHNLYLKQL